ncbi:hypothetical protein BDV96DRAFT_651530 [Lophiotrema nucula]|uniref:Uncharacterized protein n=1 Tax=Lophiotrema nucula TaxID=690887 RepID=A0A6A5YS31_9PLEO|nr:hypothetical protein BDV96DRAFT_651530 [Lophiotrema nucula]
MVVDPVTIAAAFAIFQAIFGVFMTFINRLRHRDPNFRQNARLIDRLKEFFSFRRADQRLPWEVRDDLRLLQDRARDWPEYARGEEYDYDDGYGGHYEEFYDDDW